VEKALKAYLTWHDQPFRRTHNLIELLEQCIAVSATFSSVRELAERLDPYGVASRYPGEDPTPEQAAKALRLATEATTFVLGQIPPQARPQGRV
jgi:HEPN domain-containing protein